MPKNNTYTSSNDKFIPSASDWNRFYTNWFAKIAKALQRFAPWGIVEDGVEEAFLKLQGLSTERHLEKPLEPLSEIGWFRFICKQAEWIIGQKRDENAKWRSEATTIDELFKKIADMKTDGNLSPRQRNVALKNQKQLLKCLVELEADELAVALPSDGIDGNIFAKKVNALLNEVCKRHSVSKHVRKAYKLYVLEKASAYDVVIEVWGATDSKAEIEERKNNLYQIKNRINGYLADLANEWRRRGGDFRSFLDAA